MVTTLIRLKAKQTYKLVTNQHINLKKILDYIYIDSQYINKNIFFFTQRLPMGPDKQFIDRKIANIFL